MTRLGPSLTLLVLCATTAGAQVPAPVDSTKDRPGAQSLDAVVVTGASVPAAAGGAGVVVVQPESLNIPPAPSLEQALRELPFVLVRQNSRGETELSLRGSESRQMAVLLDGIPLTLGWDHRTDPSLVPLTGAQRLVLVRGLTSLLHGPNVLGGIVEVDVARGAPGTTPAPSLSVGMGVGEHASRVMAATGGAPVAVGKGMLAVRGGVAYRSRDGLPLSGDVAPAGDGGRRANSDLDQLDAFASARWQAGGGYLGLTATGFSAERGVPPELHVASPRLWRYPSVERRLAVLSAGMGPVTTPVGFGSLEASAGVNLGSVEIDKFDDPAYRTVTGRETGDERTLTARMIGRHSLRSYGELRAGLTAGEVRYDERLDAGAAVSRYRQRLWSAGVEAETPLFGSTMLGGGLVYDEASTPETGGKPALGVLSAWGWRMGVTTPASRSGAQLHASLSRRARFPALRELYSDAINRFEPNPGLRPERLLGGEMGATLVRGLARGGSVNLQAVLFHHHLKDAIVREPAGDGRFRRVNRHALRSTGAELLAGWSPATGVSLTGDVLLQRVRVADPAGDQRAEHQPEVRGRLGLEAPLALGVELLSDVRYVGRQYCVHPDLETRVALDGRAEGDIGLAKTWTLRGGAGVGGGLLSSLRARIGVDNVTDATVFDQCGLPRPGRLLRLAVQLR